ncbi:hypothetical protein HanRHA438_Chr04g0174211 [Helianthus annuus]|uniref:Uncharacterized protein n=1 Tax=Helianthus annuus TaxID=4232 RepID=A0A9K3J7X2_HELAN|nr:uncharacterized protein LOC110936330 isoform X2 [Helianthus annuus]KAF5810029.1 hypothetical protein HanXRQr2_Chr04g0164521 [Helianthus annuus]KAJ0588684.1 hypothetical protein HanIR_Chr04g0177521 [Helianthus annuus]KAJ0596877.1 hypothetical protein HanHA89_Chr04g0148031 [Helianthus annuus]KAJ0757556.1 hypothetical protein HanLR1_Chr04g0140121 [Helianthus annuus]KAJ0761239.1 hypothetical protein HanOQP8_Chr04g0147491 [Helianthus annuus]
MPFNCADTKPNHTNQTQRNRSLQKLLSSFNFTPSSPCSQQPHTSTPSFPLSSQSTPPPRSSLIPPATTIVLVVADISSSNTTTTTGGGTVVGGAGDRFKHERRTERERSGGERETPGEKRAAPPLTAATNAGDGKNGGGRRGAVAALRFVVQVHVMVMQLNRILVCLRHSRDRVRISGSGSKFGQQLRFGSSSVRRLG